MNKYLLSTFGAKNMEKTGKRSYREVEDQQNPHRKALKLPNGQAFHSKDIGNLDEEGLQSRQSTATIGKQSLQTRTPKGFFDLPGEVRNIIYDEVAGYARSCYPDKIAKRNAFNLFCTSRLARQEGSLSVSNYFFFGVNIESWRRSSWHLGFSGATALIQRLELHAHLDSTDPVKLNRIQHFGGSVVVRTRCNIMLGLNKESYRRGTYRRETLLKNPVLQALGNLTGFQKLYLAFHTKTDALFCSPRSDSLCKDLMDVLAPSLGPGKGYFPYEEDEDVDFFEFLDCVYIEFQPCQFSQATVASLEGSEMDLGP